MSIFDKLEQGTAGTDKACEIALRQKGDRTWLLWDPFLLRSVRQPKSADPWA